MPILPPTTGRGRARLIVRTAPPLLWHLASGRPAALSELADRLLDGIVPPPALIGAEHIPRDGPFLALFNHYESPRVAAWWGPLLMSRVIAAQRTREPRQVHWLMAREWWYAGGFGRALKQPFTQRLFERLAMVYGMVRVPPVLAGDLTRGEGVLGVRHALALTRGPEPRLVGLAPEGHTGPGGQLKEPPEGAGLFLLLLAHDIIPALPIGWYEDEARRITVRFGPPFALSAPRLEDRAARDRAAATAAMTAIGRLLPERLWGAYRQALAGALPPEVETPGSKK